MKAAEKRKALVDHYLDFYALAMAILHDDQNARDAVQEALVATLTRPFVNNPVAYCRSAVYTQCINILRRSQRIQSLQNIEILAESNSELVQHVREAIDQLPEYDRALFDMHYSEGYTLAELALLTNTSISTIKRRLAKSQQTIKTNLKNKDI